jgi:2-dehydropantoate 2-reductase
MRYVIYGAGGVGGVIAARLLQRGREVVLIARGAHLDALRAGGLVFRTPHERVALSVHAVGHPGEIDFRPDDVVFLTMKTQHTADALRALRAAAGEEVAVVCCQNGVANERMALRLFSNVYAMVVILPASHLAPGEVETEATGCGGILDAGRYPAGSDERIAAVTADLESCGFSARPDPAVMRWKYAKLLMNVMNALQAACELGPDVAPEAREIARRLRREALACYAAAGIECATADEVRERRGNLIQLAPVQGRSRSGGSSWQSLARGTGDIEADYLNGEIVLLGRLHGVPTPANRVLQRVAERMARERAAPGSLPLAELRELIEREADAVESRPADAASRAGIRKSARALGESRSNIA